MTFTDVAALGLGLRCRGDRTWSFVRSVSTRRVRSRKILSGCLVESIGLHHCEASGRGALGQRPGGAEACASGLSEGVSGRDLAVALSH